MKHTLLASTLIIFLALCFFPATSYADRSSFFVSGVVKNEVGDIITVGACYTFRAYQHINDPIEDAIWVKNEYLNTNEGFTYPDTNNPTRSGYFEILIDNIDADLLAEGMYLGIGQYTGYYSDEVHRECGNPSSGQFPAPDEEYSPRLEFYEVPFAKIAEISDVAMSLDTDYLGSIIGSGLALGSDGKINVDSSAGQYFSGEQTFDGDVTIAQTMTLEGSDAIAFSDPTAGTARVLTLQELSYFDGPTSNLQDQINLLTQSAASGDITGVTAGNGLSGGGDSGALTLNIGGGSGITIAADSVALGPLTADWSQTGAFDLTLNNASSELKIIESVGGTFFGTLDVGDLSADRTYTLPDTSGTLALTTDAAATASALAANPTDCAANQFANTIAANGNLTCAALVDADVPNILTITGGTISGDTITNSTLNSTIIGGTTPAAAAVTSLTMTSIFTATPSTPQSITGVGTGIVPTGRIAVIFSDGNYTLSSTPTVTVGTDGQIITLLNVNAVFTITLQDQGTLPSSNLRLGAATRALGPRDNITLLYSAAVGDWIEIGSVNVQ